MTLRELAQELRKIFKFKYLTCEFYSASKRYFISLWNGKPRWGGGHWWHDNCDLIVDIKILTKFIDLDLSENKDEHGEIDYSKCIVEVE